MFRPPEPEGPGAVGGSAWAARIRRKSVLSLIAVTLLVGAWGAAGAAEASAARRQAAMAESLAREAVSRAGSGDLVGARESLRRALGSLESARGSLRSVWVSPARLVPFVGTEVRASDAAVGAVRESLLGALDLLDFALVERAPLLDEGQIDAAALRDLQGSVQRAAAHVAAALEFIAAAPSPRLGFVGRRLSDAERVASQLDDTLSGLSSLLDRLMDAVDGDLPFRLLVLLENGAERRATGGFIGWVALVEVSDGQVGIAQSGSVGALQVRDASGGLLSVPAPADYLGRYGEYLANTSMWVNVNLSPDFPTVAGVAGPLYEASTGVAVDAVARIDLVGLGYLLDAFPGVVLDGREIDGATLATGFLVDSYRRFPDLGEQNDYLASAMQGVFAQLTGGAPADRSVLLQAVRRAVGERRLSLAMDEPAIKGMLAVIGVDGAVLPGDPGDLLVTAQNIAANKIDLFTETEIAVSLRPDGCLMTGEFSVVLANKTPASMDWLPHEALGSSGRWLVSFYLPQGASVRGLSVGGKPVDSTPQSEFGRAVVSLVVDAEPGASISATVSWQEPLTGPGYLLTVQPQPLILPATLSVNGEEPALFIETQRRQVPVACEP